MFDLLVKLGAIVKLSMLSITDFFAISKQAEVQENTLLLVRLDAIGDYVLFRNYIEVLKKSGKYKDYKITLCGNIAWRELAEAFDKEFISDFIWIDVSKFTKNVFYRYDILRTISGRGFEAAIQPTFSREHYCGDAVIKASNAKEKIGSQGDYSNIKSRKKRLGDRWYSHIIPASPEPMMEIYRNAEFMRGLGFDSFCADVPFIDIPDDNIPFIEDENYYVLIIGALLEHRRWPIERFARLAEKIYDAAGWTGLICGGKNDEEQGEQLKSLCSVPLRNLAGKTSLLDLAKIMNRARIVVANETGPAHIAAAAGTPVVCILGGGHYGRFMPYPVQKEIPAVVTHKMSCFNCNWRCKYKPARNTPFPCINNISVEDVWTQTHILIEQINRKQDSKKVNE